MIRKLVAILAAVVAATTFVLLYGGLYDLAIEIGLHQWQAYLFPISIDGLTLAALVATLDRRVQGIHLTYAWSVVIIGTVISTFSQFLLHADDRIAGTPAWTAPTIASFPALGLAMVWHLLWILAKDEIQVREVATTEAALAEEAAIEAEKVIEVLEREPEPVVVKHGRPSTSLDKAVEVLEALLAAGITPTGSEMARRLGLKNEDGTENAQAGLRWRKRAEAALANSDNTLPIPA